MWQVVQEFRNIDTKMMPLYTIQIFLAVALNQGISITELAQLVGIDQASATRTVALLATKSERHEAEQGKRQVRLNYIELYQDLNDRRRTLCRLSQRGVNFYRSLVHLLGDRNLTVVLQEANDDAGNPTRG